jgi:hypothetical protein
MPVRPGESKTDYLARVNATKTTPSKPRGNIAVDPARPRPGTGIMPTPKPVRSGGGAPSTGTGMMKPPMTPKVSRTPIGAAARKAATMAGRAKAAASKPAAPRGAKKKSK